MKKLAMVGLMVGVIATTGVALASNWVSINGGTPVQEPKCTESYDVDTGSWSYNGDVSRAWSRLVASPSHNACFKHDDKRVDTLYDYDCSNRMMRLISGRITDWADKTESVDNDNPIWRHVIPDSRGEAAYNFVCSHNPNHK